MLTSVAVLMMERTTAFELGLVCEVFGIDRTSDGVPKIDFRVCGERPGEPLSSTGFGVVPAYGLDAAAGADLVAVPAVDCPHTDYPPAILKAVRDAVRRGAIVLSVCTGAFVLAEAGVLDGLRCTTHWRHVAELADRYPAVKVDPDVLFVDEGQIITSAGTAAGIDACLHLVRRELGSAIANIIARRMVAPPQRDGGQRQYIDLPVPSASGDSLQPVLDWMLANLAAEFSTAALAQRARMSERTFARRFTEETGTTPLRWLTLQRVLHARTLLEQTTHSVEDIAATCGLGSGALLRHHFRHLVGVTPADYRRSFSALG